MALHVTIHDPADAAAAARYDEFLDHSDHALFQQTSVWCSVIRTLSPDRPFLLLAEEAGQVAGGLVLYLFEHELGNILTSNPHAGSAGSISVHPQTDVVGVTRLLLDAARQLASDHQCATLTLTSNPFDPVDPLLEHFDHDYRLHNVVHYVQLNEVFDASLQVRLSDTRRRSNLKRNLRRAREAGISVGIETTLESLNAWYRVHVSRVQEQGGTPIPRQLFRNAIQLPAARKHVELLCCRDPQGEIVGGGFQVFNQRVADMFMLSSRADAIKQGSNYLLTEFALRWARQREIPIYNWQASNPPVGGIVEFKELWSRQRAGYAYLTKVTGNLQPILSAGLWRVRQAYLWHYVLPFAVFAQPDRKEFDKTSSHLLRPWKAGPEASLGSGKEGLRDADSVPCDAALGAFEDAIPHSAPTLSPQDVDAVRTAIASRTLSSGAEVQRFEAEVVEYVGALGGMAVSSGSAAVACALRALGVGPGAELVLPTYVCQTVRAAIELLGARPVLCDTGADGWNVDAASVGAVLSPRTAAIIVVHTFGIPADVPSMRRFGVPIVEDCAQALGARGADGRPVGTSGDYGVYSFDATKCLTAATGGMVVAATAERLQPLREVHQRLFQDVCRLSDLQAALGRSQLARYPAFLARRRELAELYLKLLPAAWTRSLRKCGQQSVYFRFPLRMEMNFDALQAAMLERGIHIRHGVDALLHWDTDADPAGFPHAALAYRQTVSIPIYPSLTDQAAARIARCLSEICDAPSTEF